MEKRILIVDPLGESYRFAKDLSTKFRNNKSNQSSALSSFEDLLRILRSTAARRTRAGRPC